MIIEESHIILLTQTKNHYSYPTLEMGISSFRHSYNHNGNGLQHQRQIESSHFLSDPNYLQYQGSHLDTIIATETRTPPKSSYIKRILLVDDDPDITLTFKAGLDGRYYSERKRFDVYAYNNPVLVVKEFKPHFYDLLLTDIYMPHMNGFELCEKILGLDVNIRVCFMSAFVVNIQALRELYQNFNFGCYIEKPVSIKYLIERLAIELD